MTFCLKMRDKGRDKKGNEKQIKTTDFRHFLNFRRNAGPAGQSGV